VAFEKYDGTNLHWDWDRDFGWHSFGTRRDEFDLSEQGRERFRKVHAHLHGCADVFVQTLAHDLERIFREDSRYGSFASLRVFTEFLGPNSFAGLHKADDPKEFVLFDVWADPFGIIGPHRFVSDFGRFKIARVIYEGKLTGKFAEDVRTGKYGVTEGVICKGGSGGSDLWMAKIKTYAFMERLKRPFGERWEDHWE
jgi:hypothetical protein